MRRALADETTILQSLAHVLFGLSSRSRREPGRTAAGVLRGPVPASWGRPCRFHDGDRCDALPPRARQRRGGRSSRPRRLGVVGYWRVWIYAGGTTSSSPADRTGRWCCSRTGSAVTRTCGGWWFPRWPSDFRVVLFDYVGSGRSDLSAWSERALLLTGRLRPGRAGGLRGAGPAGRDLRGAFGQRDDRGAGRRRRRRSGSPRLVHGRPVAALHRRRTGTEAGSAPRTSTSCWSRWSRTIWAGRRRWRR